MAERCASEPKVHPGRVRSKQQRGTASPDPRPAPRPHQRAASSRSGCARVGCRPSAGCRSTAGSATVAARFLFEQLCARTRDVGAAVPRSSTRESRRADHRWRRRFWSSREGTTATASADPRSGPARSEDRRRSETGHRWRGSPSPKRALRRATPRSSSTYSEKSESQPARSVQ